MERAFSQVQVPLDGNIRRSGQRIYCSQCTSHEDCVNTKESKLPPIAARQFFARRGWHVGKKPKDDVCPKCIERAQNERKAQKLTLVTKERTDMGHIDGKNLATNNPLPIKAEPPKAMGIEDRRIVYEKIGDVYLDPKTGYSKGWTDQRIAEELGCPRAWVSEVRDMMFGPEANQELAALRAEHKKVVDKVEELRADFQYLSVTASDISREQATLQGEFSRLSGSMITLGQRIARLEG